MSAIIVVLLNAHKCHLQYVQYLNKHFNLFLYHCSIYLC